MAARVQSSEAENVWLGCSVWNLLIAVTVLPAEFPAVACTTYAAPGVSAHRDLHSVAPEFIWPATSRPPARTVTLTRWPLSARTRMGAFGRTPFVPAAGVIWTAGAATGPSVWLDPALPAPCPPALAPLQPAATMTAIPQSPAIAPRPAVVLRAPDRLAIHHSQGRGQAPMPS